MKQFVVLVILATVVSVVLSQEQRCPPNQEWTSCGSACPPSCNSKPHQACTMQCVIGCQCKRGWVLNSEGRCVTPDKC